MPSKCFPRSPGQFTQCGALRVRHGFMDQLLPTAAGWRHHLGPGLPCNPTPLGAFFHFPLPSLLASFTSPTEANKVKHYLSFFFLKRKHPVQPPMWEDSHLFYFQVKHSDWQSFDDKQMCWNPAGVTVNFPTEALLVFGPHRHFVSDTSIQMSQNFCFVFFCILLICEIARELSQKVVWNQEFSD